MSDKLINLNLDPQSFLSLIVKLDPPIVFYSSLSLDEYLSSRGNILESIDLKYAAFMNFIDSKHISEVQDDQLKSNVLDIFKNTDFSLNEIDRKIELFVPFNGSYLTIGEISQQWLEALEKYDLIGEYASKYKQSQNRS